MSCHLDEDYCRTRRIRDWLIARLEQLNGTVIAGRRNEVMKNYRIGFLLALVGNIALAIVSLDCGCIYRAVKPMAT